MTALSNYLDESPKKLEKHMNNVVIAAGILNIDIKKLDVHKAYDKVNAVLSNEESFKQAILKVEPIKASSARALIFMQFFGLVPKSKKDLSEDQIISIANNYLADYKSKITA